MDTSPGSSRSLPITNSFSKMVGVVPAAPPPPARAHLPWSPAPPSSPACDGVTPLPGLQPRPSLCLFKDAPTAS